MLPHTDLAEGLAVAERLCALIASAPLEIGFDVVVQTSIGVAGAADDSVDSLINRADLGLYEAKAAGRNTVRVGPQALSAASDSTSAVVTSAR